MSDLIRNKPAMLDQSYDDKFTSMAIGKLRATVNEQQDKIEQLESENKRLTIEGLELSNGNITCKQRIAQLEAALLSISKTALSDWGGGCSDYADYFRKIALAALKDEQRSLT